MQQGIKVELADIAKHYRRRCLFANVNASIGPGECLAITGPNGSGKSTFLKIIAGLVRPSAGKVWLLTDGDRQIGHDERAGRIGLVSPEMMFYPALTGCENIAFMTSTAGAAVSSESIMQCCRMVGLAAWGNDRLATYSTGMRQRLKFALLLALKPPLWLLDEPSANLDSTGKQLIAGLIRQALADQVAVVIATNEAEEAAYAGKKINLA